MKAGDKLRFNIRLSQVPEYHPEPEPNPICTHSPDCQGCPYLSSVKKYLCIDEFAEAQIRDVRFKTPYIGQMIHATECPSVEEYNEFAEALEAIWQTDGALLTYAAVLDAEQPDTLRRAYELLQDLDNYERIVEGTYEYGQQRLQELLELDYDEIAELDGYMDFERYGQDCMDNDHVIQTEFGLLRRLEPPFPEQSRPGVKFCVSAFRQSQEWRWKAGRILA